MPQQQLIPRRILELLWVLIDRLGIEIIPKLGLPMEGSSPTSGIPLWNPRLAKLKGIQQAELLRRTFPIPRLSTALQDVCRMFS